MGPWTPPFAGLPPPALVEALAELTNLMLATPNVEALLDELARWAARVITPPAHCGVTLQRHDPLTVASSDALAAHADEVQYAEGDGPCLQSMRTGLAVTVDDLAAEHRWGPYPGHALGHGVRRSLSLPLSADGDVLGALNLYATVPSAFGDEEHRAAALFAAQASAALTIVTRMARHVALTDQLRDVLAGRSVIDQTLGILMDQQRWDADQAFELLRSASQHRNRKLRDVAADIVRAVSGREPHPGPFREPR
jgi:GAF domain-containing protein